MRMPGSSIEALEAGKAVFVEKPLCLTEAELEEIEATSRHACSSSGRRPFVMVGFNRRFAPAVEFDQDAFQKHPGSRRHRLQSERRSRASRKLGDQRRGRRRPHHRRSLSLRRPVQLLAGAPIAAGDGQCALRPTADEVMVTLRMAQR